jgi:large subunit ribosomal protein L20
MIRVKRGVTKRATHKKWLKLAKGFFGRAGTCYRIARERVERGMQHAFKHRKEARRNIRSLWITRINAATRMHGVSYSDFINKLKTIEGPCSEWNRKMLSECAIADPEGFKLIVDSVKEKISANAVQ